MTTTVDCTARTEELARDLAANFDRRTLAEFIADKLMAPAREQSFGNIALKQAREEGFQRVAEFGAERAAAERLARRLRAKKAKMEQADRALAKALREGQA